MEEQDVDSTHGNPNRIKIDGGSFIQGNAKVGGDFVNRDKIIYNYGPTEEQITALIAQVRRTDKPLTYAGDIKPYPGLKAFEESDAALFFGRQELVDHLLEKVRSSRFICIAGPSGSGKSSLIQAGLMVELKKGRLKGSDRWLYASLAPRGDPIEQLAIALDRAVQIPKASDYLRQNGLANPFALHEQAEVLLGQNPDQRLVVVVDQFEGLFSASVEETVRLAFIRLITTAAQHPAGRVTVILAMRADFVSGCARYSQLSELISRQFQLVGAMDPEELAQAIIMPALEVGVQVAPNLAAQVISDMQGEPGVLPLMQFALKDLFEARLPRKGDVVELRLADYLDQGGIYHALERHADAVLGLLDRQQQEIAREIFSGLIDIHPEMTETRRTARFDTLVTGARREDQLDAVVETLAAARLIIIDEHEQIRTVTIAHEKLIDAWPWLRKLVDENRNGIAVRNQMVERADKWKKHVKDPSFLDRGLQLLETTAWIDDKSNWESLDAVTQEFVRASEQAHLQDLRTAQRRRAILLGSGLTVTIVMTILAIFGSTSAKRAENNLATAERRGTALAHSAATVTDALGQSEANLATAERRGTQVAEQAAIAEQAAATSAAEAKISLARALAAQAQDMAENEDSFTLGALLSIKSLRIYPTSAANQVLTSILYSRWFTSPSPYLYLGAQNIRTQTTTVSPDGKWLVSLTNTGAAWMWRSDSFDHAYPYRLLPSAFINSVAFSPDGKKIAVGCNDQVIHVLHVGESAEDKDNVEIASINTESNIKAVRFSPDGKRVVSASDFSASVWEIATGKEIAHVANKHAQGGYIDSSALSQDGNWVLWDNHDGTVSVWEVSTGRETCIQPHSLENKSVILSPDGKLISISNYGSIRIVETANCKGIVNILADESLYPVVISPDGSRIVLWGEYSYRVYDTRTGKEITRINNPVNWNVATAAFSPDGKWIASGSQDFTVRVWNASTGEEITRLQEERTLSFIAFSPDGKMIVSGGSWNARVWYWQSQDIIPLICERLGRNMTRAEWKDYLGNMPYQRTCPRPPTGE